MQRPVLVIDDNADVLSIMTRFLAHSGYEPVTARTAAEGMRLLREHEPVVVVLEPYAFGPERWTRIASLIEVLQERGGPPVLAVSTLAGEGGQALAAGCAGFLAKPVSPSRVLREIEGLLGAPLASAWARTSPAGAMPLHRAPLALATAGA
ncbi:MAG TPA: response regulator [Longimicrobium sp.]